MSRFITVKDRIYNVEKIVKIEIDEGDSQIGITYDTRDGTEIDLIDFSNDDDDVQEAYKQLQLDLLSN